MAATSAGAATLAPQANLPTAADATPFMWTDIPIPARKTAMLPGGMPRAKRPPSLNVDPEPPADLKQFLRPTPAPRPLPTPPADGRNITAPPIFRPDAEPLFVADPCGLRSVDDRPTPRLVAHVFSLKHEALGGTFLTPAHKEMIRALEKYCAVRRPDDAAPGRPSAQAQLRDCLSALTFSLNMTCILEAARTEDSPNTSLQEIETSHVEDTQNAGLRHIAQAVMQRLKNAEPGFPAGTAVFPGGIVGENDAHAVLFELTRCESELRLRMYNTGTGMGNHHKDPENPARFQNYVEIKNLDLGLLDHPSLVEHLLEFTSEPKGQSLEKRLATLYTFLHRLGDMEDARGRSSKPQCSPNCAWKVLSAFVQAHVDPTNSLLFKAFTQSRVLEEYMSDNGIDSVDNLIDWEAGKYENGALIEQVVQEANTRFAKTEQKLRASLGRADAPAQSLQAFVDAQRQNVRALNS